MPKHKLYVVLIGADDNDDDHDYDHGHDGDQGDEDDQQYEHYGEDDTKDMFFT